jgi:hypothetical protein
MPRFRECIKFFILACEITCRHRKTVNVCGAASTAGYRLGQLEICQKFAPFTYDVICQCRDHDTGSARPPCFPQGAKNQGYLADTQGQNAIVRAAGAGVCVRTGDWTPARAIADCGPDLVKPAGRAKSAPQPVPLPKHAQMIQLLRRRAVRFRQGGAQGGRQSGAR